MKKSTYIIVAVLLLFFLSAMWLLRSYNLELIHVVVTETVIQKAPSDYPATRIEEAFDDAFQEAVREDREEEYRSRLLSISQRLEKIQKLGDSEVEKLLESLPSPKAKSP